MDIIPTIGKTFKMRRCSDGDGKAPTYPFANVADIRPGDEFPFRVIMMDKSFTPKEEVWTDILFFRRWVLSEVK